MSINDDANGKSGQGRVSLVLATAVVGLAVLLMVWLVFFSGGGQDPGQAQPSGPAEAPTSRQTVADPTRTSDSSPTPPSSAPEDVHWELFQTVALPYSDSAGPADTKGPVVSGFTHSPTGALLAGVHIPRRALLTPSPGWRKVVQQQVIDNPGREKFVTAREQISDDELRSPDLTQIAGFRFITYSPDVAVVEIATQGDDGGYQVGTSTLRWVDNRWKQELQPDGDTSPTTRTIQNLDNMILWNGV